MNETIFILLLVLIDQASKIAMKAINRIHPDSFTIIKDFFYITYAENTGAAFSILKGQRWFFVIMALVVSVVIILYLIKHKPKSLEKISLLLILAGAIGNVIDRVAYGYVIDFLDFYIFGYDFPIFNIADSCITIGAVLLILSELFLGDKKRLWKK
ncbi:MAG: signal peptidase II [Bacillota bacterium]|jgi:signal peptidase II|nr:signal peptidase II [Bacillota bacterium]NLL26882.1 signal peptidase II [Erysipelotrichia bacterium]